jgi:hypothetical protein
LVLGVAGSKVSFEALRSVIFRKGFAIPRALRQTTSFRTYHML